MKKIKNARLENIAGLKGKWRNWYTRRSQKPMVARPCGFNSHFAHFLLVISANLCIPTYEVGACLLKVIIIVLIIDQQERIYFDWR